MAADPSYNPVDTNSLESVGKKKTTSTHKTTSTSKEPKADAWMGKESWMDKEDSASWMNAKKPTKRISAGSAINSAAKYMGKKRANLKLSLRKQ
jgi:hypothetical protein